MLLVDDAAGIRLLMRMVLELDGRFEIVGEAENGKDAIELVADLQPDIVVLDVQMPFMGGMEALPQLRANAPRSKVVVFSGSQEAAEEDVLAAGAAAYRLKGADLWELVDLLADL